MYADSLSPPELTLDEGTFRAFGSTCRIVSDLGQKAVHRSVERLEDLESRWSRFRLDSEISSINRRAGTWTPCSEATVDLIRRGIDASTLTDGLFNPLVLNSLIALGYDRDHRQLNAASGDITPGPGAKLPSPFEIEVAGGSVRIPVGAGFDPGGLGKGLAADLALEDLLDAGARWAYVSLGGDARFGGDELGRRGTAVEIQDPFEPEVVWGTTRMNGGALATSSTLIRRWNHGGSICHHLLDRDGRPASGPRAAATVFARTAWWADVVAKCLLIDSRLGGADIDRWDVDALIFNSTGTVEVHGWSDEPQRSGVR